MFLTDCFECGLRELRGARSIELLANTDGAPGGMRLVYRCTRCDATNVLGAAGGPRAAAPAATPAASPRTAQPVAA